MNAYDIDILQRSADRAGGRDDGWCFGLPPGIAPEQWPLDPTNGYPLMHVFTIRLPEDYRCHGPEIVALSFFAIAPDHNDGAPTENPSIQEAMRADGPPPSDPHLLPFWHARLRRHPRLHRMTDLLGCPYAVILLEQAEFEGPLCAPPWREGNPILDRVKPPGWLRAGAAAAHWAATYSPALEMAPEEHRAFRLFGGIPPRDPAFHLALVLRARAKDPNAGKAPREDWADNESGYAKPYYFEGRGPDSYREHAWSKGHKRNHIGGTMYPVQGIPEFSPFYIEFEESMGGCNFGSGNAQLDFRDMKFDWACD